ncbi:Conserved hypothetical protein; putative Ribonuclease domain [Modestobacter italicus]|uniref:Piwi domain-containing protein n=1 Tax=Modestobacter italicus (strain DSM 44449 / CECT 9708 / BC 501) TaxID=2732864 RepID=I4EYQ5_MODI5|nr:hypothetical protein [Modestobacter marinus]CCH88518.1 Conserved hypothetical protein; putative Ribonuclease domain [Modestobacter marinus]
MTRPGMPQPTPSTLSTGAVSRLPGHRVLAEPDLVFGAGPGAPRHAHPLVGLTRHGPYSRPPTEAAIRVATITVSGQQMLLNGFLSGLRKAYEASDRKSYVPTFPGFAQVFGVDLVPAHDRHFDLDPAAVGSGPDAHERLVEALGRALLRLQSSRDAWDVVVFLLPTGWEPLRESPDGRYQLHDRLKAFAAPLGIPVQFLRESSAVQFRHHASLAWRLSIALLTKAGGTPWRIAPTTPEDTAYIGLAYAIRGGTKDAFVTCCSQVFDAEGGGMEFVAYNVGADRDLQNPHLTREEMRAVMSRSVRLYQQRHAGRTPRRISVHKTTRWRSEEVDGVFDAWSATPDIECVTVQARTAWRGVVLEQGIGGARSAPGSWPVERGTMQQLSGRAALLWVSGTAPTMSLRGRPYNPSVKGIPTPCVITRDAGAGPLEITAADVLALSKLDWNNDAAFDPTPVTIGHSQRLARVIAHVPELPDNVYPYRLFM